MTRSDLVDKLTGRFPSLAHVDAKAATDKILDAISSTLANSGRVEIRGFGSFDLRHRPPRIGRNPATGAKVQVPAKVWAHFKPGKELRELVDRKG